MTQIVLKEISGKIYVYFKHGQKWCYVGPLSEVNLSSLIFTLENYHSFTTKFKDIKKVFGGLHMSKALMFVLGISLILSAYSLSTNVNLSGLALALTVLSVLTLSTLIAFYELSPLPRIKYSYLALILSKGLYYYLIFTFTFVAITFIASLPLTSPYSIVVNVQGDVLSYSMSISLSTLLLTSMVVAFLQRPLRNKGCIIYFIIPLSFVFLMLLGAIVAQDTLDIGYLSFLALSTMFLSAITIALAFAISTFINVLKSILIGEARL